MSPSKLVVAAVASLAGMPSPRADVEPRCAPFTTLPSDARDDVLAWNQALSLAGCVQDDAIAEVTDDDDLDGFVDEIFDRLHPVMLVYATALQQGPETVRVRAAYQLGMLFVTAATRARSSIRVAPGPDAIRRNLALHAKLEPLLAPAMRVASQVFEAIDVEATRVPSLESDPVIGGMIRTARAMRGSLREPMPQVEPTLIRALR